MEVFADQVVESGSFSLFTNYETLFCLYLVSIYKNYKSCYNRCFSSPLTEEQIYAIEEPKGLLFHGKPAYCAQYWIRAFCKLVSMALASSTPINSTEFYTFCRDCIGIFGEDRGKDSVLTLDHERSIDALANSLNDLEEEKKNEGIYANYSAKADTLGLADFTHGLALLFYFIVHLEESKYHEFFDAVVGRTPILTDRQMTSIGEWRRSHKDMEGRLDEDIMIWLLVSFKL